MDSRLRGNDGRCWERRTGKALDPGLRRDDVAVAARVASSARLSAVLVALWLAPGRKRAARHGRTVIAAGAAVIVMHDRAVRRLLRLLLPLLPHQFPHFRRHVLRRGAA